MTMQFCTFIAMRRVCITSLHIDRILCFSSIKQSQSLNNTPNRYYNTSGNYLFTQKAIIQKHSPESYQVCHYSCAVNERNYTNAKCARKQLLRNKHKLLLVTTPQRHLSLAWLDRLALAPADCFRALSESQLVASLTEGLQAIHDYSHLPWWGSIILSTLLMRAALTFPLAVYQRYILAKLENLKPEMDNLVKELKKETAYAIKKFNWDETHAKLMFNKSVRKIWKNLIIRENCHPFKASALLWVQIPLWVSMSLSFRNMASMMPLQDTAAQILFLELSTGGIAWIPNLTEADHSLILPIAMGLINIIITEVNVLSRQQETLSKLQKVITNIFRLLSVVMIPIASIMPSCVVLYWVTSGAYGLAQTLLLMHPGIQRVLRLPSTASQSSNPYQHMWTNLMKKVSRKNNATD